MAPFFFKKNKKAIFEATEITPNADGMYAYTAKGKLTLNGVTKEVRLMFNDVGLTDGSTYGADGKEVPANVIGFDGVTTINRNDFGVGSAGPGLGEEVKIEITLEAIQPK